MAQTMARRLAAEALGALLLTGTVVGSGVMAADLAGGNVAVALLGNTLATAAILYVLITALGPVSGAHFNPAVSVVAALRGDLGWGALPLYVVAQVLGCVGGVALAHAMFGLPLLQTGTTERAGAGQLLAEGAATFALVLTILGVGRVRPEATAAAVAAVIAAGYWWTASTSFANPAITLARALTDTFAGIRPVDAPGFIAAQLGGALLAAGLAVWLYPSERRARS